MFAFCIVASHSVLLCNVCIVQIYTSCVSASTVRELWKKTYIIVRSRPKVSSWTSLNWSNSVYMRTCDDTRPRLENTQAPCDRDQQYGPLWLWSGPVPVKIQFWRLDLKALWKPLRKNNCRWVFHRIHYFAKLKAVQKSATHWQHVHNMLTRACSPLLAFVVQAAH